jgi:hypothetical protein
VNKDIHFSAYHFFQKFFAPSQAVQAIIDEYATSVTEKTVAVVVRTGWDDWQRFLLDRDPLKFPLCLNGWRESGNLPKNVNVFVTSDREDVKAETVKKLREMNFEVISLQDSATHVQTPDSELKILKTIAEFHLISRTGYGLLTSSSLFG